MLSIHDASANSIGSKKPSFNAQKPRRSRFSIPWCVFFHHKSFHSLLENLVSSHYFYFDVTLFGMIALLLMWLFLGFLTLLFSSVDNHQSYPRKAITKSTILKLFIIDVIRCLYFKTSQATRKSNFTIVRRINQSKRLHCEINTQQKTWKWKVTCSAHKINYNINDDYYDGTFRYTNNQYL